MLQCTSTHLKNIQVKVRVQRANSSLSLCITSDLGGLKWFLFMDNIKIIPGT